MLDAAHTHSNNKLYFFRGSDYWRYDLTTNVVDPGYPKPIARFWRGVPRSPDAVVAGQGGKSHKIYFFSGDQYTRYDTRTSRVDSGYPKKIKDGWKGVFQSGVDAAVTGPTNDKIYFFKGTQYVRFDWSNNKVDAGYPKDISTHWDGLPGLLKAALVGTGSRSNKVYFFGNGQYWRYDMRASKMDSGYPKSMSMWRGVGSTGRVTPTGTGHAARIAAFKAGSGPGAWPNLDRATVARQIEDRIRTPHLVNQRNTPMCGDAAIAYVLADQRPDEYARICIDLFETGRCRLKTITMRPSQACRNSTPPDDPNWTVDIHQADWLIMASMRDVDNLLFDIDGDDAFANIQQGITTPWEMKNWCREMLDYSTVEYDSTVSWGEEDAIKNAKKAHGKGGAGFLMIDGAMAQHQDPTVAVPTHWVVYTGGLKIDEGDWWRWDSGSYEFEVYTWGGKRTLTPDEGRFEDCMFGCVYGW